MLTKCWLLFLFLTVFFILSSALAQSDPTQEYAEFIKPDGLIREAASGQKIIPGVPWYRIQHGDGPTAVGMLFGYWDSNGFRHLIPGDASIANDTIKAIIATDHNVLVCDTIGISDHYHDYSCPIETGVYPPDPDKSQLGGNIHQDNCIADYLKTSRSIYRLVYGSSISYYFSQAFKKYIESAAPQYDFTSVHLNYCEYGYMWWSSWNIFKAEIDAGRPVILSWNLFMNYPPYYYDDSPGSEWDMIAFGYEETASGEKLFAWYNDYDSDTVWISWDYPLQGYFPDCVLSMITFKPTYTPKSILVPSEYSTLQDAIDAAEWGDTIIVADGIYSGPGFRDIVLDGKPIIKSENGPEHTIIDCGGSQAEPHRGFIISGNNIDSNTKIAGLTIKNGYHPDYGGAIFIEDFASPIIENCILINSYAANGGGIYFGQYSESIVQNCLISDNAAEFGGGIFNNVSSPTINNCIIDKNSAQTGGGYYNYRRGGVFINCNICYNSSETGAGMAFSLANNNVTVENSIIAFNIIGAGIECANPDRVPDILCTDIYGNKGGDWIDGIAQFKDINNNFSTHPLFCDGIGGDYGLYLNSLCSSVNSPCENLVGVQGVGCLTNYIAGDVNSDGEINIEDIVYIVNYYFNGGPAPAPNVAGDLSCNGLVDLTDIILFNAYLFNSLSINNCE